MIEVESAACASVFSAQDVFTNELSTVDSQRMFEQTFFLYVLKLCVTNKVVFYCIILYCIVRVKVIHHNMDVCRVRALLLILSLPDL